MHIPSRHSERVYAPMTSAKAVDQTLSPEEAARRKASQPGWLAKLLWPVTSYLFTNITVGFFWIFFFVLNRTTVIGKKNVGNELNTLLLANHQTLIDSLLIGLVAYYPKSWIKPRFLPWNPAAVENFYRTPILRWLAYNLRCIPVQEGRRDAKALRDMTERLPSGVMILFPAGTRARKGGVSDGRPGAGVVALRTKARIIPVAVEGMQHVLPIGKAIPRIGKRIYISYGEPVELDDLFDQEPTRDTAQQVVDRVMEQIRAQHADLVAR
jgi:1-acyl-sn-glycerol-3-phosphate acyltransferase